MVTVFQDYSSFYESNGTCIMCIILILILWYRNEYWKTEIDYYKEYVRCCISLITSRRPIWVVNVNWWVMPDIVGGSILSLVRWWPSVERTWKTDFLHKRPYSELVLHGIFVWNRVGREAKKKQKNSLTLTLPLTLTPSQYSFPHTTPSLTRLTHSLTNRNRNTYMHTYIHTFIYLYLCL